MPSLHLSLGFFLKNCCLLQAIKISHESLPFFKCLLEQDASSMFLCRFGVWGFFAVYCWNMYLQYKHLFELTLWENCLFIGKLTWLNWLETLSFLLYTFIYYLLDIFLPTKPYYQNFCSWVLWHRPVILPSQETLAGGLQFQGQPGQQSE